jgi:hypothetical protein
LTDNASTDVVGETGRIADTKGIGTWKMKKMERILSTHALSSYHLKISSTTTWEFKKSCRPSSYTGFDPNSVQTSQTISLSGTCLYSQNSGGYSRRSFCLSPVGSTYRVPVSKKEK